MVDGVYHMIYEELKPASARTTSSPCRTRCSTRWAVTKRRGDQRHNRRALQSASRTIFTRRAISASSRRPGLLRYPAGELSGAKSHLLLPPKNCYLQNIGRANAGPRTTPMSRRGEWIDASIAMIRPGVSTDKVAAVWPKAEDFGFPNEDAAFGLQFGHGLGLALQTNARSFPARSAWTHPMEIQTGMVFALETYCPATDGYSASADRGRGRGHGYGLRGDQPVPG